jgi:hypothetical protein
MVPGSRLIPVRVDGVEIEVEAVVAAGTEATAGGRVAKAAGEVADAFSRAEDAIAAVARSTAGMIERSGPAARPDRVEVEFGLKFSASGGVIMAGVAGEASLRVTLGYDFAARPPAAPLPPAAVPDAAARPAGAPIPGDAAGVPVLSS